MDTFELFRSNTGLLLTAVGLLGLTVGSFLNVVILRLPRMMEAAWQRECRELLLLPKRGSPRFDLMSPPSRCPGCGTAIAAWQNVPVLSWLLLRGRCANCATSISIQYPLVEVASGLLSLACAWHFGWSIQLLAALILTWALIALTVIDLRTMLLPDDLTLPLLWLGMLLAMFPVFASLHDAVLGAAAGYLSLWLVFHLFKLATGKEGMGYGDFKLFAVLGAWMGWQALPIIILMASAAGALIGLGLIASRRTGREMPLPFGPYLAAAGWFVLLWGEELKLLYFNAAGIH